MTDEWGTSVWVGDVMFTHRSVPTSVRGWVDQLERTIYTDSQLPIDEETRELELRVGEAARGLGAEDDAEVALARLADQATAESLVGEVSARAEVFGWSAAWRQDKIVRANLAELERRCPEAIADTAHVDPDAAWYPRRLVAAVIMREAGVGWSQLKRLCDKQSAWVDLMISGGAASPPCRGRVWRITGAMPGGHVTQELSPCAEGAEWLVPEETDPERPFRTLCLRHAALCALKLA